MDVLIIKYYITDPFIFFLNETHDRQKRVEKANSFEN